MKPPVALAAKAIERHDLRELTRIVELYNWLVTERLDEKARRHRPCMWGRGARHLRARAFLLRAGAAQGIGHSRPISSYVLLLSPPPPVRTPRPTRSPRPAGTRSSTSRAGSATSRLRTCSSNTGRTPPQRTTCAPGRLWARRGLVGAETASARRIAPGRRPSQPTQSRGNPCPSRSSGTSDEEHAAPHRSSEGRHQGGPSVRPGPSEPLLSPPVIPSSPTSPPN